MEKLMYFIREYEIVCIDGMVCFACRLSADWTAKLPLRSRISHPGPSRLLLSRYGNLRARAVVPFLNSPLCQLNVSAQREITLSDHRVNLKMEREKDNNISAETRKNANKTINCCVFILLFVYLMLVNLL